MKMWVIALLLISALLLPGPLSAFQGFPKCSAVDPDTAKAGDTVSITCQNADKANVSDLYLTDGTDDTKVAVTDHTEDKIKFQVPKIKAGRYHIAFLNANKSSMRSPPRR